MSTTVETRSISDLEFPGVVVCPAKNSFTTLNPDMIRDKNSWDENTTRRLEEILMDATFDLNVENKYKEMTSFFEKDKFFNWYKGESELSFPYIFVRTSSSYNGKKLLSKTAAVSGQFSTPYFGETFHEEEFVLELTFYFSIYVPEEIRRNGRISLMIDIDYDIEESIFSSEAIRLGGSSAGFWDREKLNATLKKYKKEFSLHGDEYYFFDFKRQKSQSQYKLWKSKRHTGMRVSWYYNVTVQADQKYLGENQEFISLVNALHENRTGLKEKLMRKRHEIINEDGWCDTGRLVPRSGQIKLPSLVNVSTEPVYTFNITQETLATAGRLYFYFREGFI